MNKLRLLFIHGAGGTKSKWREVIECLEADVHEAIDLPGHGSNVYNVISSIQDHAAFIDQSITEDTIVVGHSMGGLIGLELAARNKKVKGLVLAASFYELPVHPKLLSKLEVGEGFDTIFKASYADRTDEKLLDEERKEIELVSKEVTYADFKACDQYQEGQSVLSYLPIPVCAILGKEDKLVPPDTSDRLKELKPEMKIVEIENAGHYVMLEKPKEFAQELLNFAKEVEVQTV